MIQHFLIAKDIILLLKMTSFQWNIVFIIFFLLQHMTLGNAQSTTTDTVSTTGKFFVDFFLLSMCLKMKQLFLNLFKVFARSKYYTIFF